MISATDLKSGTTFLQDGNPYKVIKYTFQKIGRGGATVKLKIINLKTGTMEEKTMGSASKVDEITTSKLSLQYLYNDGQIATFMNPENFEQVEISFKLVEDELLYIKEGEKVGVMFWEDKPLSVEIPPKVSLVVKNTPPGVKGDSATNMYKPAVLENGLELKVPLFIKEGDRIRVDTRTGAYVERVK